MGLVFIDITMACDLSFYGFFFLTKTIEISKFHFEPPWSRGGGNILHVLVNFHWTYEWGLVIIDITMVCDI